jgi:hypothetical protein
MAQQTRDLRTDRWRALAEMVDNPAPLDTSSQRLQAAIGQAISGSTAAPDIVDRAVSAFGHAFESMTWTMECNGGRLPPMSANLRARAFALLRSLKDEVGS